jgi:hypothetical protein
MKTCAYIINNNNVIAEINTELKNGQSVTYAYSRSKEEIDANRKWCLCNSKIGKISRNNKYKKSARSNYWVAEEIMPKEFYVY